VRTFRLHALELADLTAATPSLIIKASQTLFDGSTNQFDAPNSHSRSAGERSSLALWLAAVVKETAPRLSFAAQAQDRTNTLPLAATAIAALKTAL
jgi:hypothetical protein